MQAHWPSRAWGQILLIPYHNTASIQTTWVAMERKLRLEVLIKSKAFILIKRKITISLAKLRRNCRIWQRAVTTTSITRSLLGAVLPQIQTSIFMDRLCPWLKVVEAFTRRMMLITWLTKINKLANHLNRPCIQIISSIRVNISVEMQVTIINPNLRLQQHFSKTIHRKISSQAIHLLARRSGKALKRKITTKLIRITHNLLIPTAKIQIQNECLANRQPQTQWCSKLIKTWYQTKITQLPTIEAQGIIRMDSMHQTLVELLVRTNIRNMDLARQVWTKAKTDIELKHEVVGSSFNYKFYNFR